MSYTYDPATDTFTLSSTSMKVMIYRLQASKEQLAIEDAKENLRRIHAARARDGLPVWNAKTVEEAGWT